MVAQARVQEPSARRLRKPERLHRDVPLALADVAVHHRRLSLREVADGVEDAVAQEHDPRPVQAVHDRAGETHRLAHVALGVRPLHRIERRRLSQRIVSQREHDARYGTRFDEGDPIARAAGEDAFPGEPLRLVEAAGRHVGRPHRGAAVEHEHRDLADESALPRLRTGEADDRDEHGEKLEEQEPRRLERLEERVGTHLLGLRGPEEGRRDAHVPTPHPKHIERDDHPAEGEEEQERPRVREAHRTHPSRLRMSRRTLSSGVPARTSA